MPRKNIKLPLHRGNDYPDEVRKMALDLLRRRRKRGLSMRDFFLQVAKVCDVRSPKTIEQWHRKYIQGRSDTPVRGRPVSLTAEEERVLMGEDHEARLQRGHDNGGHHLRCRTTLQEAHFTFLRLASR